MVHVAADYVPERITSLWIDPVNPQTYDENKLRDCGNDILWNHTKLKKTCLRFNEVVAWGSQYCPDLGGDVSAEGHGENDDPPRKVRCTYSDIREINLFRNSAEAIFAQDVLNKARQDYCYISSNLDNPDCIDLLTKDGTYQRRKIEACLELAPDQTHVSNVYPWADDDACLTAILENINTGTFTDITIQSEPIDLYCSDARVKGDTNQTKGFFDPICSCINRLNYVDCEPFTAACTALLNANPKQYYGSGCPAGCAEQLDIQNNLDTSDPFQAQVLNFLQKDLGGPYCYTEACSAGRARKLMQEQLKPCSGNIQLCLIDAENNNFDNSSFTASCKQEMNIADTSGCEYGEWGPWGKCDTTTDMKARVRTVNNTPAGQTCSDTTDKQPCTINPPEPTPPPIEPPSTNKLWIIIILSLIHI